MNGISEKTGLRRAVTIMELVIAMAMIGIIFAAILPQFALIRNSWDSKQGAAEALQNGRVLMDHISRNLSKAKKITDVSEANDIEGHIEYEDNDGNIMKYEYVASGNRYVKFGPVGSLSDLAGPVSSLTFTCYDACDLDNFLSPVSDANLVRVVEVQATLTNAASLGRDYVFTDWAYLRVNAQSGDSSWQNQDIGNVAADGSASCSDCDWTIDASGNDIWDNTDEFHYVYQSLSGDGQIIARVVSVENTNSWAKAGVMIRETLNGNSKHAMMVVTPGNGTAFQRRTTTGGSSDHTQGTATATAPYWVKIVRSVNTFTGYESANGSVWTQVGSVSITMVTDVYIGLCVTSHNDGTVCTAEFDNVSFNTITYETFNPAKVGSDSTSITISTPTTDEGDLLIAAVATDGDTSSSLEPPGGEGWNEIDVDDNSGVTLGAWWKLADASESTSHEFDWTGSQQAYGWMMRFTGHDASDPIDVYSSYGESSSTPASPAVTTTVNNCMILRLGAFDDDDITIGEPGLSDHTAITMDESASSSTGQVSYEGFDEGKQTSSAWWADSVVVPVPSGTSQGDLLIAAVVTNGDTDDAWPPLSPPAGQGWAEISLEDYSNAVTLGVWWKLAGASEPSSHEFTWSGGREAYGWIMRFTGHYAASPINNWSADGGLDTSSPYRATSPSVTTTVANCLILRIGGFDDDDVTTDDTGLDNGHTDITMDDTGTGSSTCSGGAGYIQQPSIGSSGTVTFDLGDDEEYRTVTIAIAPAVATGGTVSGGAGYVLQSSAESSGTSNFSLGSSNEAQMLTIAIAPADSSAACCGEEIRP